MAQRKPFWNTVFAGGSTIAGFCQGVVLGGLVQGVKIENGAYAGGRVRLGNAVWSVCGLGVVAGYALLGATWLMMKTDGDMAAAPRASQSAADRCAGLHGRGQPLHAAGISAHRAALADACRTFSIWRRCRS